MNTTITTNTSVEQQRHIGNNPSKKNYHLPTSPKSSPLNLQVDIGQSYTTSTTTASDPTTSITMARSESFAYANSSSDHMSRVLLFFRSNSTAVTATVGFLIFILLVTSDAIMKGESSGYSGLRP